MTNAEEQNNIRMLQAKVRRILEEAMPDTTRGLLLENLIEQAYLTARVEMANEVIRNLRGKP